MNNKKSLVVGLFLLVLGLGGAYASYDYGKRVGQTQGYEWGQRKGRLEAARERIRAAGGGWPELRTWLAARWRDPDQVLQTFRDSLTEVAK